MRIRDPERLTTIADAATTVFGRQGFTLTQMADVAVEAGVSVGTLYNYVENKEALLVLCALHGFGIVEPTDLPFTVADRARMVEALRAAIRDRLRVPGLEAVRGRRRPATAAEVSAVAGDLYDLLAATRRSADAFERCAVDAPDIATVFYEDARGRLIAELTDFIAARTPAALAPSLPAPLLARHVVETLTWLARHRHHDAGLVLSETAARAAAVALVERTLAGPTR